MSHLQHLLQVLLWWSWFFFNYFFKIWCFICWSCCTVACEELIKLTTEHWTYKLAHASIVFLNHTVKIIVWSYSSTLVGWYMFSSTGVKTNQNMSYGLKEPVGVWHGASIIPLQHLVFLRKRITKGTWQCSDRGSTLVPGSEPSGMDVQSCLVLISWQAKWDRPILNLCDLSFMVDTSLASAASFHKSVATSFLWGFLHC